MVWRLVLMLMTVVTISRAQFDVLSEHDQVQPFFRLMKCGDEGVGRWGVWFDSEFFLKQVVLRLCQCNCVITEEEHIQVQIKRPNQNVVNCRQVLNPSTFLVGRVIVFDCEMSQGVEDVRELAQVLISRKDERYMRQDTIHEITLKLAKENTFYDIVTMNVISYPNSVLSVNRSGSTRYPEIKYSFVTFDTSLSYHPGADAHVLFFDQAIQVLAVKINYLPYKRGIPHPGPGDEIGKFSISLHQTNQSYFVKTYENIFHHANERKRIEFRLRPEDTKNFHEILFYGPLDYTETLVLRGSQSYMGNQFIDSIELSIMVNYSIQTMSVPVSDVLPSGVLTENPGSVTPTMDVTTFNDMWVIDLGKKVWMQKLTLIMKPFVKDTLLIYFSNDVNLVVDDKGRTYLKGNTKELVEEFKLMYFYMVHETATSQLKNIHFRGPIVATRFVIIRFEKKHRKPHSTDIIKIELPIITEIDKKGEAVIDAVNVDPSDWMGTPSTQTVISDVNSESTVFHKLKYMLKPVSYITLKTDINRISSNIDVYVSPTNDMNRKNWVHCREENKNDFSTDMSKEVKFKCDKKVWGQNYVVFNIPKNERVPPMTVVIRAYDTNKKEVSFPTIVDIDVKVDRFPTTTALPPFFPDESTKKPIINEVTLISKINFIPSPILFLTIQSGEYKILNNANIYLSHSPEMKDKRKWIRCHKMRQNKNGGKQTIKLRCHKKVSGQNWLVLTMATKKAPIFSLTVQTFDIHMKPVGNPTRLTLNVPTSAPSIPEWTPKSGWTFVDTSAPPEFPTPDFPTTDFPSPDFPSPDFTTTDFPTPDFPSPDFTTTDFPSPDFPTTDFPSPDFPTTDFPTPDFPTPDFPTPDFPTTDFPTPDFTTTDFPSPDFPTTDFPSPDFPTPDFTTPDFPSPDFPTTDFPQPTTKPLKQDNKNKITINLPYFPSKAKIIELSDGKFFLQKDVEIFVGRNTNAENASSWIRCRARPEAQPDSEGNVKVRCDKELKGKYFMMIRYSTLVLKPQSPEIQLKFYSSTMKLIDQINLIIEVHPVPNVQAPDPTEVVNFIVLPDITTPVEYITTSIGHIIKENNMRIYLSKSNEETSYKSWVICQIIPSNIDGEVALKLSHRVVGKLFLVFVYSQEFIIDTIDFAVTFYDANFKPILEKMVEIGSQKDAGSSESTSALAPVDFKNTYKFNQINIVVENMKDSEPGNWFNLFTSTNKLSNAEVEYFANKCVFLEANKNEIVSFDKGPEDSLFSYVCSKGADIKARYLYISIKQNKIKKVPFLSLKLAFYNNNKQSVLSLSLNISLTFETAPKTQSYKIGDITCVTFQPHKETIIDQIEILRTAGLIDPSYFMIFTTPHKIPMADLPNLLQSSTFLKAGSVYNKPSMKSFGQECNYYPGGRSNKASYACQGGQMQQANFVFNSTAFIQGYLQTHPGLDSFEVKGSYDFKIFRKGVAFFTIRFTITQSYTSFSMEGDGSGRSAYGGGSGGNGRGSYGGGDFVLEQGSDGSVDIDTGDTN